MKTKKFGHEPPLGCCSPIDEEKFSSDLSKCMNRAGAKTSSVVSRGFPSPHDARPGAKMAAWLPESNGQPLAGKLDHGWPN